jgi:hypothetical protein
MTEEVCIYLQKAIDTNFQGLLNLPKKLTSRVLLGDFLFLCFSLCFCYSFHLGAIPCLSVCFCPSMRNKIPYSFKNSSCATPTMKPSLLLLPLLHPPTLEESPINITSLGDTYHVVSLIFAIKCICFISLAHLQTP